MQLRSILRWARRAGRIAIDRDARSDALHEWQRRRGGEPRLPAGKIERVVVVCYGNICRSPFAGALLAREEGALCVRSAGFAAVSGKRAEPGAKRAAGRFGVDLDSHEARRLSAEDLAWADLVLVMEGHHVSRVTALHPEVAPKVRLLGDFLPEPPHRIEDPWGRSDEVFAATFERIGHAVRRVADRAGGTA